MKTKLTLNVDDKIVERAKRVSARRKVSLSSVVEQYLERYSESALPKKDKKIQPSLLERIRKYTKNAEPLPEDYDYKKALHDHLDEKYGK
jgi:antitoxin component of RelBE/YafQ-DinJ toxin-antitoxin module